MEALANSVFIPSFIEHYPTSHNSSSSSSSSCCYSPISIRTQSKRIGPLRITENPTFSQRLVRSHAVPNEASGSGPPGDNDDNDDDNKSLNNGFGLVSEDIVSFSDESKHYGNKTNENTKSRGQEILKSSKKDNTASQVQQRAPIQQTSNKLGDLIQRPGNEISLDSSPNTNTNTNAPILPPHGSGGGGGAGGTRAGLFRTPISGGVQSATSAHGLPRPALAVRNLMEQARFAHLCTIMSQMHHRREGYPFGSLVDFAPDSTGHPIFSFSPLAIHTRNLLADPRCTLVVQIPGWSGLSNARVTIFGDVYPLPEHQQEWAHKQYIAKHQQGPSQQWGNFYYFRMQNISDIYFIGGFGTVAWVDVKEYEAIQPDKIAVDGGEQNLKELNAIFSKPLKDLLSAETEVDDAALISIDSKGIDIRVRQGAQFNIQRISFDEGHPVETLAEAKDALWKLINKGRVCNLQK